MRTVLVFLLGGLSYALLELTVAASVVRWFPGKLHYFQSVGDALIGWFRKPTPDFSCDTGSVDDEATEDGLCQCPVCKKEREEACQVLDDGDQVVMNDDRQSYGISAGVITGVMADGEVYDFARTECMPGPAFAPALQPVLRSQLAKVEKLIPEGTAVRFYNSKDCMTYNNGVTFKAKVEDGNLVYTVEYGTVDDDVSQVEVTSDMIWVK